MNFSLLQAILTLILFFGNSLNGRYSFIVSKNAFPIECTTFTRRDSNKFVDDNGKFYITPWDSFIGGRIYAAVYTSGASRGTFTLTVKKRISQAKSYAN